MKFIERYKENKERKLHDYFYNEVFSYIRNCTNGSYYVTISRYTCEGRDRIVNIARGVPCRFISVLERKIGIGLIFKIGISYFPKEEEFAFFYYSFVLNGNVKEQIENFQDYINRNFMKVSNDN